MSSALRPRNPLRRVAVVATLGVLAAAGCDFGDDPNAFAPPPPPEVVVANPVTRGVTTYLQYTGVIEASEIVDLRARVQGFLESIEFHPGQRVKAGDLLFVIDKRQYEAEVEQAEASVRSLEAALEGADNDAKLARELADQKAGPEIEALIKAAARDSIAAELARAQAAVVEARLNLDFCEVRAPIDGRVTRNLVDQGNLVGRSEPTLLASIVKASPCYVSVDVS
ncbi:MAG: efflux RND transporter periplasmic adaptor subunit, partial [Planctomycetota bacterium]|nr:efflux RND transporter periplasmic adaptor subunit [Planctomycetota bacterium]